jgi:anti-sigma regulatory factor (Ser/Thr protein kinase)
MEIEASAVDGSLEVLVRDHGRWRPAADRGGGWGLQLMRALMDSVDVDHGPDGTEVRMRRRIASGDDG